MTSFAARSLPLVRSVLFFSQTRRSSCTGFSSVSPSGRLGTRSSTVSPGTFGKQWYFGRAFTATREFSNIARRGPGHRETDRDRGTIRSLPDDAIVVAEEDEEEEDAQEGERRSKNQRKRDSSRARRWGIELAGCTPAQVKQAVRWAGLSDEVYDAVIIVKNLGNSSRVRNGRRRQLNYIGGLLRDVDPNVMEPVLKAARNGDFEGITFNTPPSNDSTEEEPWAEEEEEKEEDSLQVVVESWLEGMIAGSSETENEIYSIFDIEFDRQELRKLVRAAQTSSVDVRKADEAGSSVGGTKSHAKLRSFLVTIARQQAESQAMYS